MQIEKDKIKSKLAEYCDKYESQVKAANSLKGVSVATINQILNSKWESISDAMWLKIAKQIGYTTKGLNIVETANFKYLTGLLDDAAVHSLVYAVIDNPGASKSKTTEIYAERNKRVYRLVCKPYWNRKMFLYELLSNIGGDASGLNINEMMNTIVRTLKVADSPLIILDEVDKLNDQVLHFFITLYNELQGECGIVMCSTDHFKKRIERGLRLNKMGYKEIYSRLGRRFIQMPGVNSTDVAQICMANGITNKQDIKDVIEDCEYDLRRVERKIHAIRNAA